MLSPGELTLDAILASACAPLMFQAIEIDGEPYWDGSYAGNPMLWPLVRKRRDLDPLPPNPLDFPCLQAEMGVIADWFDAWWQRWNQ